MCGIAGWLLRDPAGLGRAQAEALGKALHHRGPDDAGVHLAPGHGLALVHRRLSIIDPGPAGHQPMIHAGSGDVLVFNGEIYNHAALREELAGHGHYFASRCDTEVLLQALVHWGLGALERAHGMYAFAWWHAAEGCLHLVRDPMGIKPLYYMADTAGGGVVFSSELGALRQLPDFVPRVDGLALRQYMEFGYTFDEHRTMFAGVRKLPPGHRLEVRPGRTAAPLRHFTPSLDVRPAAEGPAIERALHDTLGQVVREQLSADVPVALLLSGGLDSSLLAALAARETRLHTFSFGFAESAADERSEARRVARHLGTEHEEILISPDDVLEDLDEAVAHFDDLFADWGLVSTRLAYRRCRQRGAKVVLVGEGADELFAGYEGRFRPGLAAASGAPMDWRLFRLYRRYIGRRYGGLFPRWRRRMREYLAATGGDLFAAIRLFETRDQLPNNFVMKVDKASMAASVEARVPFLDARVARIAYQVPGELALGTAGTKLILRSMARRYALLPDAFIERGKVGTGIANSWLDTSPRLRRHARDVVLDGDGWVDALGLRRAMTAYFHGGRSGFAFPHAIGIFRNVAWRLLLLNLWSRRLDVPPPHG